MIPVIIVLNLSTHDNDDPHDYHDHHQVEARVELDTRKQLTARMFFLARFNILISIFITVINTLILKITDIVRK